LNPRQSLKILYQSGTVEGAELELDRFGDIEMSASLFNERGIHIEECFGLSHEPFFTKF